MAPKYTVYYFPIKALAEPIRLILSYANVDFEDVRISSEEWPKHKDSMPLGQMPVLQIDDKKLYQSGAICRYLARKFNLAGKDDTEALEIDIAVDTINDLRLKVGPVYYETDEAIKEEKYAALAETIPFLLSKMNESAGKNNGYLALGKLTWADFFLAGVYDYLKIISRVDIGAKYPNLQKVVDNVLALPQIKAWYAKSPKCDR